MMQPSRETNFATLEFPLPFADEWPKASTPVLAVRRIRGNSQPAAIAPEMPISTIAPTTSPCSPVALPSLPPSFSPTIDITKLMNPNRLTAKTIG
jgi:hypothetical protein